MTPSKSVFFSFICSAFVIHCVHSLRPLNVAFVFPKFPWHLQEAKRIVRADIDKRQLLSGYNTSNWPTFITKDRYETPRAVLEYWKELAKNNEALHGLIGPGASDITCEVSAMFSASYDIPQISYGCGIHALTNTKTFRTYLSLINNLDHRFCWIVRRLAQFMYWQRFVIVADIERRYYSEQAWLLKKELESMHIQDTVEVVKMPRTPTPADVERALSPLAKEKEYVIFLLMRVTDVLDSLRVANRRLSMFNGNFLFVSARFAEFYLDYERIDTTDAHGMLVVDYPLQQTRQSETFREELLKKSHKGLGLNVYSAVLYDATLAWAKAVNRTLRKNIQPDDARFAKTVVKLARKVNFRGMSGRVRIHPTDATSFERKQDVSIFVLQNGKTKIRIMDYYGESDTASMLWGALDAVSWPGGVSHMPASHLAEYRKRIRLIIAVTVVVAIVIVLSVVLVVLCCFVKRKLKREAQRGATDLWELDFNEIELADSMNRPGVFDQMSSISHSQTISRSGTLRTVFSDDRSETSINFVDEAPLIDSKGVIGYYKGRKMVVMKFEKPEMAQLTRQQLIAFVQMRHIQHDNVNEFIGASINPPFVYLCTNYCAKGSLCDLLSKKRLNLSWDFRLALIIDIAKGMLYLHDSPIGCHGHLTSRNCLVDARWTCKVTDYGLPGIRQRYSGDTTDAEDAANLLWTAPELLRMPRSERPTAGTKPADVYSFSIIVQEVCYQDRPFGNALRELGATGRILFPLTTIPRTVTLMPQGCHSDKSGFNFSNMQPQNNRKQRQPWSPGWYTGIISRVRQPVTKSNIPFRPSDLQLPPPMAGDTQTFNAHWLVLMELCWHETPASRPSFPAVLVNLKRISGGRQISAVDNMVKILEVHTQKMEDIAIQRSLQAYQEKERGEELLCSILPREVVGQLRLGQKVLPENFDAVTICLADIVSFTPLAASMKPHQVIKFLSALYNLFDHLIDAYDIYKVETIGDAYLIASGLPVRNGYRHAMNIATFALHMRSCVRTFVVPDFPDKKLQMRIGMHSGPIVAGVVGMKMPRYCLFGETLIVTYLVSAATEAAKISVSETTHKILTTNYGGQFKLKPYGSIDRKLNNKKNIDTFLLIDV